MSIKRSNKFYRRNEKEVMRALGFEPTPNSGSGWIIKEDGQNENAICQLKSTDANSIRINQKDIETLEYNALVSHKIPVFVIQFLNTDEVFLVIRPELLSDVIRAVKGKEHINNQPDLLDFSMGLSEAQGGILKNGSNDLKPKRNCKSVIKSSADSRKDFMDLNDSKYQKKSKSAK